MRGAIRYEPSALLHAASVLLQWSPRVLGINGLDVLLDRSGLLEYRQGERSRRQLVC